jgi:hypothetical protein
VQTIVAANRFFEEVWSATDRLELDKILALDFTWVTPNGVLLSREEALAAWPKLVARSHEAEVTHSAYGRLAILQIRRENTFTLRLWVSQPKGWRLVHIIDAVQTPLPLPFDEPTAEEPTGVLPSETGVVTECVNPCEVIPFRAHTQGGRTAVTAWQQMQIAAAARDMAAWAAHVADNVILVDSAGESDMTKARRIELALEQKEGGARSNEAPPLLSAQVTDLGGTVIMYSLEQPYKGPPFRATRVWVDRGGRYQLVLAYHVVIRDVPSFTLSDQLDRP